VMIVLAKDWFHEPESVLERIERILRNQSEANEVDDAELEPVPSEPAKAALTPASQPRADLPDPQSSRTSSPKTESKSTTQPTAPPATRHFEYIGGGSRKFWEISVSGTEVRVRFGRIGTAGQEQTRTFADAARARREADKLIGEKLRKGYTEAG